MARNKDMTQGGLPTQGLFVEPGMLAKLVETTVRRALEEEMTQYLGAGPYERTEERRGLRNGTKPRRLRTAVGELAFEVPQSRDGGFRPTLFERYQRSDQALVAALQEMVVAGVSTRRVAAVLEEMAGFEVSAATVSRTMAELDEQLEAFRTRQLEREYPFVFIDARYEKVRVGGRVRSQAVLIAAGINDEGRREILSYALGDSESEATWSDLLISLKKRGLKGVCWVISDAHGGIRAALGRHFQGVRWQRCRVHLMRELLARAASRDYRELSRDLRAIFHSEQREQCLRVAGEVADKWETRAPKMSRVLREGIEDTLAVWDLPAELRRRLHSTNMLERQMRELKRRTRVVTVFPSQAAGLRLIGARLLELHENWIAESHVYINLRRMP
jgi:putative transposase